MPCRADALTLKLLKETGSLATLRFNLGQPQPAEGGGEGGNSLREEQDEEEGREGRELLSRRTYVYPSG